MLRTFTGLGVALLLVVGTAYGQNPNPRDQGKGAQAQGQAQTPAQNYMQGKIVRVDSEKGTVVIRGANGKEQEFRTAASTKYFGTDRQALKEGLRARDFRQGADVMWRAQGNNLSELRLGTGARPGPGGANPGTRPPAG